MGSSRVVYQNWIVDLGFDPDRRVDLPGEDWSATPDGDTQSVESSDRSSKIRLVVGKAISHLDEEEQEFVIHFYFMGESYQSLSDRSGRAIHKLEAVHRRAIRKLKRQLASLVDEMYGLSTTTFVTCPVCRSPDRAELDSLIADRDRRQTWRPVLKELRERFGMKIRSPQILIGHEKYHMQETKEPDIQPEGEIDYATE